MDIFTDDQTATNEKQLIRKARADAGGPLIGVQAEAGVKDKPDEDDHAATLSAVLAYQDQLAERLMDLLAEREAILEEIKALDTQRAHLSELAEAISMGDLPERNPDGTFKDQALEDLISAWERRTGRGVDREDGGLLLAIITAGQDSIDAERDARHQRLREIDEQIGEVEAELGADRAEELTSSFERRYASFSNADANNQQRQSLTDENQCDQFSL